MELGTSRRRHPQGGVTALLMLLVACFCTSLARADAPPTIHFDIPAGDAQKTLLQFLSQSNIEMLYSSDDIRGVTTHAVSGNLTVAEALRQMFEGTGLEISFENEFTFASIKPAKKVETGPETPRGVSTAVMPRDLWRPDTRAQALAQEPKLQEVVVTGTLIHGVLDIMSPLTRVSRSDMQRASFATVQDALQTLTLSSNAGPSEDVSSTGNFGRGVAANLRGLGSGATLVLIDGYRQPFSGTLGDFVDISNIPSSAVERLEILPDGTSALYGSDAIAGVVNVIMRKDLAGGETWVRLGTAPGGANEKLVAQLFGTSWQSGRALFSYQYSERTALAAAERAYSADTDKRLLGGTDLRSFRSSPGNILDPRTLQPSYGIPAGQDGSALTVVDLLPGQINLQNRYSTYELLPDKRTHSAFFSASQKLGERTELSAEGRFSRRDISQRIYAFDQILVVPSTNPFAPNPYAGSPYVLVGYSFLDTLGPMRVEADTQTYSGSLGLKTKLTDTWRLTFSGSYGRETMHSATKNLANQGALNNALAATDPALAFNPFGDGSRNSPAVIDALRMTQFDRAASGVASATFVTDGTVRTLPSGDAKLAVGGEWRDERFGNVLGGGMPFARNVQSGFAELSVPIVGDPEDPNSVPRLELSLAGRYENYSDFGSTWNPKIGLRWAPSDSFKVRASWGTSFKAPRLTDLYDTSHKVATLASFKDPRSPSGSSVVLASQGNNPDLTEETAMTWTAGVDFAFQKVPGSTLSLTYYSIDYTDRIVIPGLLSPSDILLQEDQWASIINRNPSRSDIEAICNSPFFRGSVAQCKAAPVAAIIDLKWRNLAATRMRGVDLKLDQMLDTSYHGSFKFGLAGSYILNFEQAVSDTSPIGDLVDTVGNPLALRLRGTAEWYQHKWDQPGFGVGLTIDHAGGYRDTGLSPSRDVAELTVFDVQLSYRTPKEIGALGDTELILNATNVFNQIPPFVNREEGYDTRNIEPYGRVVSFSIQKKW